MPVHPKSLILSLLLLCLVSGVSSNITLGAQHAPATPQASPPAPHEVDIAALEANAARYPPGLIVTAIGKDSPVEQAGLKVGDVLLSFDGVSLRFDSQIGPMRDKAHWDGKKTIILIIRRGTELMTLTAKLAERLGLGTRPPLPAAVQLLYDEASALPDTQKSAILVKKKAATAAAETAVDARAAAWLWYDIFRIEPTGSREEREALTSALSFAESAGDMLLAADSLYDLGVGSYQQNKFDEAEVYFQRALAIREKLAPNSLNVATSVNKLGSISLDRGRLDAAETYYKRALVIREKLTPDSPDVAGNLYNMGNVASDRGKLDEAEVYYKRALAIQEKLTPNSFSVADSLYNLGLVAFDRGKLDEAEAYYKRALTVQEKLAPDSLVVARSLNNLGAVADQRGKLDEAAAYDKLALIIREKLAPDSLDVAGSLNNLGTIAEVRGKLDEAETYIKRALALYEKLAPNSLDLANILNNLGNVAYKHVKLDEAEAYYKRALAIREKLAPDSLALASSFNNLGVIAEVRGKLDEAAAYNKRALTIHEKLAPNSLGLAICLNNLGNVAFKRGKLDEAEVYQRHALAIQEKVALDSLNVAMSLNNLGNVSLERGQLDAAEAYYKRALAIKEKVAPDSLDVAGSLDNLGTIAANRGKLDEAETYIKHALALYEKLAPDSLDLAGSLNNLGAVAEDRGQLDASETYYKRALVIKEKVAPDSLDVAGSLNNLGNVAQKRDKLDEAEVFHNRALALYEKIAPNSLDVAASLYNLGIVAYKHGKFDVVEELDQKAWQIVLKQGRQVAGDSGRQDFGKAKAFYATNLVVIQLKRGKFDAAFKTLEEGRAQALVQAMSDRSLTQKGDQAALWQAYQLAKTAHNVAFKDAERAAALNGKAKILLKDAQEQKADATALQSRQQAVEETEKDFEAKHSEETRTLADMESAWAAVRRANTTALPPPLDPNQARKRLPAGTLMLEFAVSAKDVLLFAASADGVKAYLLPISREELEAKVAFVRRRITQERDERGVELVSGSDSETEALRTLFQKLFPPDVQKAMLAAKRIVLSPDAFLWNLPFAALITNTEGAPSYLGLQKPLSYTQSLTVFFLPSTPNEALGTGTLVIGNPLYANERRAKMIADAKSATKPKPLAAITQTKYPSGLKVASVRRSGELGMMTRDGSAPTQLPDAEEEARKVALLYQTSAHIGVEPTEAWFRQRIAQAKILHLATHGTFNPDAPASSGILLAVPEKTPPVGEYDNDGTLQAWEVWSLKVKAALVILSACETGRGRQVNGEGLIGLTRAWQYAGAQTIVSSQWKVNDASTAALMVAFHQHLKAGSERDEALRQAMADVAHDKAGRWTAPYHWAAFVLVGQTAKMP